MRYPVRLAEEAGGVHETLKLPGSCGSRSAVRPEGFSAAVHKNKNIQSYNCSCDIQQSSPFILIMADILSL